MTTATMETPVLDTEERVWTPGLHRCEGGCGAEAFAVFIKGDTEFLFCNHHRRKHEDALITAGYAIEVNPKWAEIVSTKPSV